MEHLIKEAASSNRIRKILPTATIRFLLDGWRSIEGCAERRPRGEKSGWERGRRQLGDGLENFFAELQSRRRGSGGLGLVLLEGRFRGHSWKIFLV